MKFFRPFVFLIFLLVGLSTSLNAQEKSKKITVQLNWKHQFEFAGFYAAIDQGFYALEGLDVELKEFSFNKDVVNDVVLNKADFGITYPSLILEQSKSNNLVLLKAILQSSPHILISLESSGINSIKDFKNKKIMIDTNEVKTASFVSMLQSKGVSLDDMELVKQTFNIDDLINKKVDLMAVFKTNQLYVLDQLNIKYKIWDPKDYGFDFYDSLLFTSEEFLKNNPKDVSKFVTATLKGWEYAFNNIEKTVDIILKKYNTQNKTKFELINEANELKKLAYKNNYKVGHIDKNKIQRLFDVYNIMGLTKNNIDLNSFIYDQNSFNLSQKEKSYLKNNPVIKMCNNPNWKPIEFKENNKVDGIVKDVLTILEDKLNVKIEHVPTSSWKESQEFLKNKKCDILPAAIKTAKRVKYANFTQPYLKYKLAIITTKDKPFVNSLQQLVDDKRTIARKKASGLVHKLKTLYPDVKIIQTKDYLEAIQKVSKGEVYCTIATLPVVSYYMNNFAINNLQIAGYTNMEYKLSIAVRDDKYELLSILDKALLSLDQKKITDINNQWSNLNIQEKKDFSYLYYILLLIVVVSLILFIRQRLLKKQNRLLKQEVEKRTKELEREKNRFKLAIEGSNEGIFDWNVQTNEIYFSPRWKEQIGYKDDELKNDFNEWKSRVHPDDLPVVMEKVNNYFKGESTIFETTHRLKHKNGKWIWIDARAKALIDNNGKIIRLIGSHNDVTELVEYRESLEKKVKEEVDKNRKSELQLMEQSKMASMGEMIGNIAHQWRQPLSVITTSASALQIKKDMNNLSDECFESSLETIIDNANYLSTTVDTFRNFVKEEKTLKEVVLQERIDKALNIVSATLKNNHIKLINNIDYEDKIKLMLVTGELAQVIINIINNAKDILVEKKIDEPWIKISIEKTSKNVVINIEDNAGGIPQKIMPYIFDPYFTTKHQSQGTGLGLHMSYRIITESLNGNLGARNTQNGALFFIELPLS